MVVTIGTGSNRSIETYALPKFPGNGSDNNLFPYLSGSKSLFQHASYLNTRVRTLTQLTEHLAEFCVVQVGVRLRHPFPLVLRPAHEGVHRPANSVLVVLRSTFESLKTALEALRSDEKLPLLKHLKKFYTIFERNFRL